jgi:hypothetical protein
MTFDILIVLYVIVAMVLAVVFAVGVMIGMGTLLIKTIPDVKNNDIADNDLDQ